MQSQCAQKRAREDIKTAKGAQVMFKGTLENAHETRAAILAAPRAILTNLPWRSPNFLRAS